MESSPVIPSIKTLRLLDFGLAVSSLTYGALSHSRFWLASGLLGLILAWLNPAKRMQAFLFSRRIRRTKAAPERSGAASPEDSQGR